MRILIADDEYLARSSLKSMLEELNLPLDYVGEAANGEEMLAAVRQHLPDVAFVDIRMPRLNGLEAIRRARTVSPCTRWFILTGFPEFEYAQEAIRLGVSTYLLKPVNPEELSRVLQDFIEDHRKQIQTQNRQFERELVALAYGLTSFDLETQDSSIGRFHYLGAAIYIDSHLPETIKAERQTRFCRLLREHLDRHLDLHNRLALFVAPGGELTTTGAWEPRPGSPAKQRVLAYLQAVEQEAQTAADGDLVVTLLTSRACPSYPAYQEQLEQLHKLAPLRLLCGVGKKLELTQLTQEAGLPGAAEISAALLALSRSYQERSYLGYMNAHAGHDRTGLEKTLRTVRKADFRRWSTAMAEFLRRAIHFQAPAPEGDLDGAKAWIQALHNHGERLLSEIPREEIPGADIVNQVVALIDQNYTRDISIGQLAEQLNITPNYLSTLFHKKTGSTFLTYLKRKRLLKAKELLADPNRPVHEVAEQVGYVSVRHFARLFAEQFGCLPSEFRDRFKSPSSAKDSG